ncbi:hypothetical protein NHL50_05780 [Acidimicrobiia bacterium EGI L10123]|uniref:hypothetical protein n=1 Tax=Salinilacustrithrix flava TaxID=2957203 RepID=UPI003D7C3652|nr:hypothetical protein [Acidimicrobiia bacterium EGI L10123]
MKVLLLLALSAVGACLLAQPAVAQAPRDVRIEFEVGDFDPARSDWPITEVLVSGDLDVGETFVVELRDGAGAVIWAGEDEYSPPQTIVTVDSFVAVGDVDEAAIGQRLPEETATLPPEPVVEGNVVTNPTTPPPSITPTTPPPPAEVSDPPAPPPTVEGDVIATPEPELPQQGSGLVGAGQLALSMVIAVVFVAILFRAPLPAATTQRWRR